MADADDVQTSTVALVGLIGAIALFGLIVLLQVIYYRMVQQQLYVKQISPASAELSEVTTREQARLNELPGWRDRSKGVVHLPIELAMDLAVKHYASGASDPPVKVTAAPPAPAKATAHGKEKDNGKK